MQYIMPSWRNFTKKIKELNLPDERITFEAGVSLETLNKFFTDDWMNVTFKELMSLLKYLNANILDFILPNFVFENDILQDPINLYNAFQNTRI